MTKPRVLTLNIGGMRVPFEASPEHPVKVMLTDENDDAVWLADVYADRTEVGNWPDGEEWVVTGDLDHTHNDGPRGD